MTDTNQQTLPAGLGARAAAAASAPAPVAAPAAPAPSQPFTSLQQPPEGFVGNPNPAPAPAPYNPMLSAATPDPAAQTPAPVAVPGTPEPAPAPTALQPVEVPKPQEAPVGNDVTVAALAGTFAADVNLAPAVGYLDTFCKEKGLDINRAFGKAAEESDSRFIDTAYLTEKLGKEGAEQLAKVGSDVLSYINAYTAESVSQVHQAAGGEDKWDSAAALFSEKADPMDRQVVADLLNSGDRAKMQHAAKLVTQFAVQAGGMILHNAPAMGTPGGEQGITQAQHIENISKRNISQEEYERSVRARQLGRSQGL